jgi:hypothetical protein
VSHASKLNESQTFAERPRLMLKVVGNWQLGKSIPMQGKLRLWPLFAKFCQRL